MSKLIGQTDKFGVEVDGTEISFLPRAEDSIEGPEEKKIEERSYSSISEAKKAAKRYIEKNGGQVFDW